MKMKFKKFLLGLILLIVSTGIFPKIGGADAVWSVVPGCGGTNGINTAVGVAMHQPAIAVCGSALYAAWVEKPSSANEIHIKKFEGSSWTNVGNTPGQTKLNISSGDAGSPALIDYNGVLYAAWHEIDSSTNLIHVKRYSGGSWTFVQNYAVSDGRNCINANPAQNAKEPTLLVFNNELYAAWQEFLVSGIPQIRVSKFNDSSGLWSSVDGSGLNRNASKTATRPSLAVYKDPVSGTEHLYISWIEENSSGYAQIRVRKYNGGTSWPFIDDVTNVNNTAGTENGLNKEPTENSAANMPVMAAYNDALYVAWVEGTYDRTGWGAMSQIRLRRYNGTSWAWVDGGLDPGLNKNCQVPAVNPVLMAFGNKLYLTWEEMWEKELETEFYSQIRVMSYNGTPPPSFIDENLATGLNFISTHDKDAYYPNFTVYKGDLYVIWHENNATADQIRMKSYPLPPVVTSVTVPANANYKVGQNLDFVVNFSKAVTVTGTSPTIPLTFNSGSFNATYVSGSGTALTFRRTVQSGDNDDNGIAIGSNINLSGGAIRDTVNNLDADLNLNNVSSTTGVLVDGVAPTKTTTTPADGATDVGANDNLVINFNENIAKGTGNIKILKSADNSLVETIDVASTRVTMGAKSATIDPSATFASTTGYYVTIDAGAFTDVAGNNYAGILTTTGWNFFAKDTVAPSGYTVWIDQPYINKNNKENLSFTFYDAEYPTTYNYTLTSSNGGTPVTGSGTVSSASHQVTGVTTLGLNEGALTLSVTLTDMAGNTGSTVSDTVLKDTSVPSGYSVSIGQAYINIANQTAMSFRISGAETGASYIYSITSNGGGTPINNVSGTISSGGYKDFSNIDTTGLADGTLTVTVTMTDIPGNTGSAVTASVTKNTVRPSVPSTPDLAAASDSGISNTDNITNITTPTFSGTADAGSIVKLYDGSTLLGTATATGGSWSITSTALSAGSHSITATATNAAGNTSNSSGGLTVTIDNTVPAAPSIPNLIDASDSGISNTDNITNITTPTFSGTADAGSTVKLYDGSTLIGTATATGGSWSITSTALSAGSHTITATATNAVGNTSSSSLGLTVTIDSTAPAAPSTPDLSAASDSGISNTDNLTNITTPTFSGTAEAGSIVKLYDGSTLIGTATATGGNWSITSTALSAGSHTITATATDAAGNASSNSLGLTVTIDSNAPAAPSTPDLSAASDSGISNTDNITNITTPIFSGTADTGSTVKLYDGSTLIGTATATGGSWSITSTALSAGSHSITATATDPSGNASNASGGLTITIDTTLPTMSGSIASSNSYIDLTFNEGVYGIGGSLITKNSLSPTFTSGTITSVTINSVKKNNSTVESAAAALTGGETIIRVFLKISGNPSSGNTIAIKPADGSSIFDQAGNPLSAAATTGNLTFYPVTAVISAAQNLYETNMATTLIKVALSGVTFKDDQFFPSNFVLDNPGITISNLTLIDINHCSFNISGTINGNINLGLTIKANAITSGSDLNSNTLLITDDLPTGKQAVTIPSGNSGTSNNSWYTAENYQNDYRTVWNSGLVHLGKGVSGNSAGLWLFNPGLIGTAVAGQIPSDAKVDRAELILKIKHITGDKNKPRKLSIYQITDPDAKGQPYFNYNATEGLLTGLDFKYRDHRLGRSIPWRDSAGSSITDSIIILDTFEFIPKAFEDGAYDSIRLDISDAVKAWVKKSSPNQGLYIAIDNGSWDNGEQVELYGLTSSNISDRPQLYVTYLDAGTSGGAPPEKVSSISATPKAQGADLAWSDTSGASGYRVVRKCGATPANPNDGTLVYDQQSTTRTASDTGLENGKIYYYAVFAYNANSTVYHYYYGGKAYTQVVPGDYSGTPTAPGDLTVSLSGRNVNLSWTDRSTNETGFKIYGDGVLVTDKPTTNQSTYCIQNATVGLSHTYQVTAYNKNGESSLSNPASLYVPALPETPSNITWSIISSGEVQLRWKIASGATSYRIEVRDGNDTLVRPSENQTVNLGDADPNYIRYPVLQLTPNVGYRFRIIAVNATGESTAQTELIVTPEDPKGIFF